VLPFYDWSYGRFLVKILRAAKGADAVVLRGTSGFNQGYAEAVAALLIKLRWSNPPLVLVADASWDPSSAALEKLLPAFLAPLLPRLGRLGVRIVDGEHMRYGVLSTDETKAFKQRWGIDEERVRFTPYWATVSIPADDPPSDQGYVFAGGNTNRDFRLLVDAAEGLDVPVRIASGWQPDRPLPPNVTVTSVTVDVYDRMMRGAKVVVVPLKWTPRSVGQQTYLSGMRLGKPVIVTDSPGVRDYVVPGETALVVESNPAALREALTWVLDPANHAEVELLANRARQAVEDNYLGRHYFNRLWQTATEEAARRAQAQQSAPARRGAPKPRTGPI
jgi:glycosyltransferase involved in cell wall biosynthesis